MTPRRLRTPVLLTAAACGFGALLAVLSRGQDAKPPAAPATTAEPLTEARVVERVTRATDKALDYLESKQIKEGTDAGSWSTNQAFNAVAMLAFMSKGHTPGRGKYGDAVEDGVIKPGVLTRGKKYLLSKAQPNGCLAPSNSMYEHGLATLCLAEMYGMDPDPDLEDKLRTAVDLIVATQKPRDATALSGGWRYQPAQTDADLSVTVMQVVALRAANNAGILVPKKTFADAVAYIQASAQRGGPDGKQPTGGFGYQGPGNSPQTSAGGTLSLQLLGQPNDPAVAATLEYLLQKYVKPDMPGQPEKQLQWGGQDPQYFYYFHYYAIQAFYQAGGKGWNDWHPRVRELLLAHQNPDGSWDVPPGSSEAQYCGADKTYPTAMATLVLNIYMHYLPAYQR
jgi:hypothetical protein